MKYLYNYSIQEFINSTENNGLENWWIFNQNIHERYNSIKNNLYVKLFKAKAIKNNIQFSDEEIVSWIDNIQIIYCTLNYIKEILNKSKQKEILKNIQIIGEYHIPYSSKRADIIMVKDNKILIIELSYKKENMNRNDKYQEKLNQVMNYKELLENALPKHIEIATYSFPIEPETDELGKPMKTISKITNESTTKNYDYCCYLAKFIINFFQNTNKSAIEELNKLKDDYIEYNFKPKEFIKEII